MTTFFLAPFSAQQRSTLCTIQQWNVGRSFEQNTEQNSKQHTERNVEQHRKQQRLYTRSFALALLVACSALFMSIINAHQLSAQENIYENIKKFSDVLNLVSRNYVDTVNVSKLTESAIRGLLSTLDPHSVYLPANVQQEEQERFAGNYAGIGVMFKVLNDTITVLAPSIGGPSERLGLQCNDKIVKIDNQPAVGLKQSDVPKKLKGEEGTRVTVHIKREGLPTLIPYTITREAVAIRSVDAAYMLEGTDVGYIYVNKFAATTTDEVLEAAQRLKKQGMKKLVLDLRYNAGGLLSQAFALADEIIPSGKTIVFTKTRGGALGDKYVSTKGGALEQVPIIVLINAGSASASEIVAGAVQDLDRGLVVGETSFGKGLVQVPFTLPDKSAFRLTTARYYTPSGRCIQRDYNDKNKYYALEGREELEEGSNVEHRHERSDSTRPKFKTSGGRVVFGGGGIVPDYVVKADSVGKLRRALITSGVIVEYGDNIVLKRGNEIRSAYNKDLAAFLQKFPVTDTMIAELKALALSRKVAWDDADFKADEQGIKRFIKSWLSTYLWTTSSEFSEVYAQHKEIDKAVELFPESLKIAKMMIKQ